jgi:hypothetical protein
MMPDVGVSILARALGVESVGLCDPTRLVVSADEMNSIRVSKLEADEEGYRFDAEQTTIDIIPYTDPISAVSWQLDLLRSTMERIPRNR